jgi:hypothetical protein
MKKPNTENIKQNFNEKFDKFMKKNDDLPFSKNIQNLNPENVNQKPNNPVNNMEKVMIPKNEFAQSIMFDSQNKNTLKSFPSKPQTFVNNNNNTYSINKGIDKSEMSKPDSFLKNNNNTYTANKGLDKSEMSKHSFFENNNNTYSINKGIDKSEMSKPDSFFKNNQTNVNNLVQNNQSKMPFNSQNKNTQFNNIGQKNHPFNKNK